MLLNMHNAAILAFNNKSICSLSAKNFGINELLRSVTTHQVFVGEDEFSGIRAEDLIHVLQSSFARFWIEAENDGEVGIAEDAEHEVETPS